MAQVLTVAVANGLGSGEIEKQKALVQVHYILVYCWFVGSIHEKVFMKNDPHSRFVKGSLSFLCLQLGLAVVFIKAFFLCE